MQHNLRKHGDEQLAAQRFNCDYSSRPEVEKRAIAAVLAKDLRIALDKGDKEEAKRVALALRPIWGFLDE